MIFNVFNISMFLEPWRQADENPERAEGFEPFEPEMKGIEVRANGSMIRSEIQWRSMEDLRIYP
jgi:hypothetical protein